MLILDVCGGSGAWSKPYTEAGDLVKVIDKMKIHRQRQISADMLDLFDSTTGDLGAVAELLQHASLETTKIYTGGAISERVSDAMAKMARRHPAPPPAAELLMAWGRSTAKDKPRRICSRISIPPYLKKKKGGYIRTDKPFTV